MPSLFDSHDEFNEWFSKDIESAAENKGSKLNEHQLRRLHMILKPFMLRRVKRNVQNELSEKIEKDIYVDLSARQRGLYRRLLANVSVADLLEKAANIGDADSARSLMNLVMQFRKVCNHPELFERADVVAPFSFSCFGRSGPLSREGDFISLPYSTRNPIEYAVPELFYRDGGLLDIPNEGTNDLSGNGCLAKLFNIWSTDWIQSSLYEEAHSSFSFLRFLDLSPGEAHSLHIMPLITRRLVAVEANAKMTQDSPYSLDPTFAPHTPSKLYVINPLPSLRCLEAVQDLPGLDSLALTAWAQSYLSRPGLKWFVPPAVAPVVSCYCTDRTFLERQTRMLDGPLESLALYGLPPDLRDVEDAWSAYQTQIPGLPATGLMESSPPDQLPTSAMQIPEAKRLIYDSAKLARLDALLQELKAGDHRVLVYFQMTRMMDLMEEYLVYRQYKYLRLDGSSKLEDRRDMVIDWQTRPDIFVFLLSTRAGGLGINLTAADTVVFYDHDWNPSNDAQAMDRAHRLGQTRQVTVYRLITKGTIDERIVQLARVKKDVQDLVVGNKSFTDVTKPSEIMQLLLNDDQLASFGTSGSLSAKQAGKRAARSNDTAGDQMRDLWNEEGDDFFGHAAPAGASATEQVDEDKDAGTPVPSTTTVKKRKGATGAPRGRRPGSKNKPKDNIVNKTGDATPASEGP
jgi:DNA helicase INO80